MEPIRAESFTEALLFEQNRQHGKLAGTVMPPRLMQAAGDWRAGIYRMEYIME